jgi:arylsulfatase A-like enzyme
MSRFLPALAISIFMPALPAAAVAGGKGKPNIVIILADDLGNGDLGCYGHPKFKTPHLDKLATQGARLSQFNTPMPYCAPTRASLLTGRYPSRCGMPNNPAPDGGAKADAVALPGSEITLAQLLKLAGYATGMVGKWHLGHAKAEHLPTRRGFDEYLGILYSNDMRPVRLMKGELVAEYPLVQATLTDRYTQWALDFIERNKGRPFFLYFAHAMPHKPLACSEAFYKKSSAGLYGDVIAELDASVGRVLAKLKELGLDDNTLVIFTSDNGPWYGGSTGGLRGMKGTTWEGGYRVPCVVRWPGRVAGGHTSDALATTPDLFPTALAAAGVAAPRDRIFDGRSLLPLLSGKGPPPHDVIFSHSGEKIASVRDQRWKLHLVPAKDRKESKAGVKWIDPRGPDGVTILAPYEQYQPSDYPGLRTGDETRAFSLFDLASDPGEQKDVAALHPDLVARLKQHHERFVKELGTAASALSRIPSRSVPTVPWRPFAARKW